MVTGQSQPTGYLYNEAPVEKIKEDAKEFLTKVQASLTKFYMNHAPK